MNPYLTLKRHADEDEAERELCATAEPLVKKLERGLNCFSEDQFRALVGYLLPEEARVDADRAGKFDMGPITIARIDGRLVSLSDLARETGILRTTLWHRVNKLNLRYVSRDGRKLYDIKDLATVLLKRSA